MLPSDIVDRGVVVVGGDDIPLLLYDIPTNDISSSR
jgi:hypothetical protein